MLSQEFIEEMKTKLLAEQERLSTELSSMSDHTELGSYDENAQEVELDDVNKDMRLRVESDLQKISKALQNIEAGSYGVDEQGNAISENRLRAIPWADTNI